MYIDVAIRTEAAEEFLMDRFRISLAGQLPPALPVVVDTNQLNVLVRDAGLSLEWASFVSGLDEITDSTAILRDLVVLSAAPISVEFLNFSPIDSTFIAQVDLVGEGWSRPRVLRVTDSPQLIRVRCHFRVVLSSPNAFLSTAPAATLELDLTGELALGFSAAGLTFGPYSYSPLPPRSAAPSLTGASLDGIRIPLSFESGSSALSSIVDFAFNAFPNPVARCISNTFPPLRNNDLPLGRFSLPGVSPLNVGVVLEGDILHLRYQLEDRSAYGVLPWTIASAEGSAVSSAGGLDARQTYLLQSWESFARGSSPFPVPPKASWRIGLDQSFVQAFIGNVCVTAVQTILSNNRSLNAALDRWTIVPLASNNSYRFTAHLILVGQDIWDTPGTPFDPNLKSTIELEISGFSAVSDSTDSLALRARIRLFIAVQSVFWGLATIALGLSDLEALNLFSILGGRGPTQLRPASGSTFAGVRIDRDDSDPRAVFITFPVSALSSAIAPIAAGIQFGPPSSLDVNAAGSTALSISGTASQTSVQAPVPYASASTPQFTAQLDRSCIVTRLFALVFSVGSPSPNVPLRVGMPVFTRNSAWAALGRMNAVRIRQLSSGPLPIVVTPSAAAYFVAEFSFVNLPVVLARIAVFSQQQAFEVIIPTNVGPVRLRVPDCVPASLPTETDQELLRTSCVESRRLGGIQNYGGGRLLGELESPDFLNRYFHERVDVIVNPTQVLDVSTLRLGEDNGAVVGYPTVHEPQNLDVHSLSALIDFALKAGRGE